MEEEGTQAKLSMEEMEIQEQLKKEKDEEEAKKRMAVKDADGGIAIQTSSMTLPQMEGLDNSSKKSRAHPAKTGMSHAGQ